MDKSEPELVPQWLKSGGNASHLSASALLHSDDHALAKKAQYRSSLNGSDRLSVLERTTSVFFRRSSSSNGSANLRASSSFSRSQRDRDWDDVNDYLDKEKLVPSNYRHHEHSHLLSKFDKDKLQRSQSVNAGKQDDTWSKKVTGNLTNVNKNRQSNSDGNGLPFRVAGIGTAHSTAFEQDFPSLGTEEKQGSIVRVSSPVLSTGIHTGNSDIVDSDNRKLPVIEVPAVTGSSTAEVPSPQQPVPPASATPLPNIMTGLNMAEALAQGPSRARTPPQSTAGIQRFEELAIRQAKLIPMTPTPKALVVSPSEKSKPKIVLQQNSLHLLNHTNSPARPDSTKVSNERRLQVLKPIRELNGVSSASKDGLSPTNGIKTVNSPGGSSPLANAVSVPVRSIGNNTNHAAAERYPSVFRPSIEKRSTFHAQSRNDFFNHLKKTSSTNSTLVVTLASSSEKSGESVSQVTAASVSEHGRVSSSSDLSDVDKRGKSVDNGDAYHALHKFGNEEKDSSRDVTPNLDEEEAAFLRSLGWDENAGEDEGLTEEEIRAFCEKHKSKMASSKVVGSIQPIIWSGSCNSNSRVGVSSCTPSSSDSDS
ncbi:uncharacterized protein [Euphorbia lathyris]|uniref:uncharacterized protein n=1 Tax=Euphorbia lathyris TaxID=212925 RepID=UPI003313CFF8